MNRTTLLVMLALLLPTASAQDITVIVPKPEDARAVLEEHDDPLEPFLDLIIVSVTPPWGPLLEAEEALRDPLFYGPVEWPDVLWVDPVLPGVQRDVEGAPYSFIHCGHTLLTDGDTGVSVSPHDPHVVVFVALDFEADPSELWDYMSNVLPMPDEPATLPEPVEVRNTGAGADAGICAHDHEEDGGA